ncbi:hypothetical protein SCARD494_05481 [Seiridium cardinale]
MRLDHNHDFDQWPRIWWEQKTRALFVEHNSQHYWSNLIGKLRNLQGRRILSRSVASMMLPNLRPLDLPVGKDNEATAEFREPTNGVNGTLTKENGTSFHSAHGSDADPVCIVGLACRLPGGIDSPSQLWDFLAKKQSAHGTVPDLRFQIEGFYHPGNERAGAIGANGGYFLQRDVRLFDNGFFGINNLEATHMDPLQRQLLEVVYECLENAGTSMESVSGTKTGVYVGNFTTDYLAMQTKDPDYISRYNASGSVSHSTQAVLLQFIVFIMPSEQSRQGIVILLLLQLPILSHLQNNIWEHGPVEFFRLSLNVVPSMHQQMVMGEVKRNGKTPGIMQPNPTYQEAVIRQAYKDADLNMDDTDYVECHGTGTSIGDPIEVDALAACFCPREGELLRIGSVKTNLGHSEAASGLTSLMKVALSFDNGYIPATVGIINLNPALKLEARRMKVVTDMDKWPRKLRRASVNSFGYGGANAHLILESLESFDNLALHKIQPTVEPSDRLFVLPLSAATPRALRSRVEQVTQLVKHSGPKVLPRLALTLTERRSHLKRREYLLVKSNMNEVAICEQVNRTDIAGSASGGPSQYAFVFTGQGAQYPGMGKELLKSDKTFSETMKRLDQVLRNLEAPYKPDWTLEQTILLSDTDEMNQPTRSQPVCTALQIGLVNILHNWGVMPKAVVGHSSGEIAAAYGAGLISEAQAITTAYLRGYALGQIPPTPGKEGAMLATALGYDAAEILIKNNGLGSKLSIGCVNSPESVTLTGSVEGIDKLEENIKSTGKFARRLKTGNRAYHSHSMQEIGPTYEELLSSEYASPGDSSRVIAKMYSSVGHRGEELKTFQEPVNTATYWRENLEKPVQFHSALENLLGDGKFHVIEIGPHPALKGPVQQIRTDLNIDKNHLPYFPTLTRGIDATMCMTSLAGNLYIHGHELHWTNVNDLPHAKLDHVHDLAPYPWEHDQLLWHEPRASVELRNRQHARHELLGVRQVAGDDISWSWRNILRLKEIPWIRDHRLEDYTIFPAAGYLAVAIEALSQILNPKNDPQHHIDSLFGFQLRNVSIDKALFLPDDLDASQEGTELHTTLSPQLLSTTLVSSVWYDFTISSWVSGHSTVHCVGEIRADPDEGFPGSVLIPDASMFEKTDPKQWYEKSNENGFGFKNSFRSLVSVGTDASRLRPKSSCSIKLIPPVATAPHSTQYPIHPITIDACIQAGIISGTCGHVRSMGAWLPVSISEARIRVPAGGVRDGDGDIQAESTKTGLSTRRMSSTLRDDEGKMIVNLIDLQLSSYTHTKDEPENGSIGQHRHPCLRIKWRPDITRLNVATKEQLTDFVKDCLDEVQNGPESDGNDYLACFGVLLELAGHKNPALRVLEIGATDRARTDDLQRSLRVNSAFPLFRSWHFATLDEAVKLAGQNDFADQYDVILVPEQSTSQQFWAKSPEDVNILRGENGIIITALNTAISRTEYASNFQFFEILEKVLLTLAPAKTLDLDGKDIMIVLHKPSTAVTEFANYLKEYMQRSFKVKRVEAALIDGLEDHQISKNTVCVSMLEVEHAFLGTMSSEEMAHLRQITDAVSCLLWLTSADVLVSPDPDMALAAGLFRALRLEQPSLSCLVMDLGPCRTSLCDLQAVCERISGCLVSIGTSDDTEFALRNGLVHVSRFGPDEGLNSQFTRRMVLQGLKATREEPLGSASPVQLSMGQAGRTDSIHFAQVRDPTTSPPPGYIDVAIKAANLNAKDVSAMSDREETIGATTLLEFSGVITAVGPGVQDLEPGDRVVVMAPNHFRTVERVPSWTAQKLLPSEDVITTSTLPFVYSTALYALHDRAALRDGESVLIHSGASALGLALITIAQQCGAVIYATVGKQPERDYLVQNFGIPSSHIFSSHDETFVRGLLTVTSGRGVNVIVNSVVGDLMYRSWECIARFGRFVDISRRELADVGRLNMHIFLRGATFTAFDLTELFYSEDNYHRDIWTRKLEEVIHLYRSGRIKAGPITTFDISNTSKAYRHFSNKERIGNVVISLENPDSRVHVAPSKYHTIFSPEKWYLLIGCLGGLGRSLSRWMRERGAKNFCFLSRTGCDKPSAQALVDRLRSTGATVTVARGDVSCFDDVVNAVSSCKPNQIGGVVQAAMQLQESLFTSMTSEAWHGTVQPKRTGTWNLHHALEGHDLDFFFMTSSMSGSVGTATESNYCAANSFLDAFARWRRSQGKPAVSVGLGMISEVGYLHENPDIEALLLRRGIQPLNEDEFLQVVDMALSGTGDAGPGAHQNLEESHILTGFEDFGIRKLMSKGFEVDFSVGEDSRLALLSTSVAAIKEEVTRAQSASKLGFNGTGPPWLEGLPLKVTKSFVAVADAPSLEEAVARLVKKRLSNLILLPIDQIDTDAPFSQYGMDSMISSEFRTWFWNAFQVDVPSVDLMNPRKDMQTLVDFVCGKLNESPVKRVD